MCHNKFMKKSKYLLIPIVFLLTSCGEINIGFSDGDTHSAGFDRSVSSQNNDLPSFSYMNNMSLDNSGLTKATLTFANMDKSVSDIQDLEKIQSFFNIDQAIISGVENPHHVGVKDGGPFYLGAESTYVLGELTLKFNVNIKNVEITAKQYNYLDLSYNQDKLVVDEEVAISVNDSGYIRVEGAVNQEEHTVASTVCAYRLSEQSDSISIKVGKRRAIIESIALYY